MTLEDTDEDDLLLGAGRSQSVRGVRFGQLLMQSPDMVPVQEYVAIKPTRIERAIREAAAATLVNTTTNENGIRTYQPLGFLRTREGAALVTRFAPRTISFDNVLWADDSEVTDSQVVDALAKSAMSLATLHSVFQMSHGDAQPKNMAWNHVLDKPWIVDLEDAKRHIREGVWDFEEQAEADLATLMLYQPKMRGEDLFELVADKYISYYMQLSGNERPLVKKDYIMQLRNKHLQPLPKIAKR